MSEAKRIEQAMARLDAMDDQEWAAGVEWFDDSPLAETLTLRMMFVKDEPDMLIKAMQADYRVADVVQRLGLLAFDEIIKRSIRAREQA